MIIDRTIVWHEWVNSSMSWNNGCDLYMNEWTRQCHETMDRYRQDNCMTMNEQTRQWHQTMDVYRQETCMTWMSERVNAMKQWVIIDRTLVSQRCIILFTSDVSHLTYHIWRITYDVWHTTYHIRRITSDVSHLTYHIWRIPSDVGCGQESEVLMSRCPLWETETPS